MGYRDFTSMGSPLASVEEIITSPLASAEVFTPYAGDVEDVIGSPLSAEAFSPCLHNINHNMKETINSPLPSAKAFTPCAGVVEEAIGSPLSDEAFTPYAGDVEDVIGSPLSAEAFSPCLHNIKKAISSPLPSVKAGTPYTRSVEEGVEQDLNAPLPSPEAFILPLSSPESFTSSPFRDAESDAEKDAEEDFSPKAHDTDYLFENPFWLARSTSLSNLISALSCNLSPQVDQITSTDPIDEIEQDKMAPTTTRNSVDGVVEDDDVFKPTTPANNGNNTSVGVEGVADPFSPATPTSPGTTTLPFSPVRYRYNPRPGQPRRDPVRLRLLTAADFANYRRRTLLSPSMFAFPGGDYKNEGSGVEDGDGGMSPKRKKHHRRNHHREDRKRKLNDVAKLQGSGGDHCYNGIAPELEVRGNQKNLISSATTTTAGGTITPTTVAEWAATLAEQLAPAEGLEGSSPAGSQNLAGEGARDSASVWNGSTAETEGEDLDSACDVDAQREIQKQQHGEDMGIEVTTTDQPATPNHTGEGFHDGHGNTEPPADLDTDTLNGDMDIDLDGDTDMEVDFTSTYASDLEEEHEDNSDPGATSEPEEEEEEEEQASNSPNSASSPTNDHWTTPHPTDPTEFQYISDDDEEYYSGENEENDEGLAYPPTPELESESSAASPFSASSGAGMSEDLDDLDAHIPRTPVGSRNQADSEKAPKPSSQHSFVYLAGQRTLSSGKTSR
ncbi:hypothetical protein VTJ04DRAFT_31 [Mycothermus thermophilus]|uniref:uncharacterized protein n=1 Tax=Humicola insolens TaxID=85995 RepID=UPI003742221D